MMDTNISYFLIGGNGFIGSAFASFLNEKGAVVNIIGRGEISDSKSLALKEAAFENLNISKAKNIVIDFAYTSVPNTSFADPIKDFSENLYNVNAHLAFATKLPGATYIHISSGGTVYGNTGTQEPIKEIAANTPLSPYGITKLASEKYTLLYEQVHGLDVKIIRPSNIYGPGQKPFRGQGFVATAIAKIISNEPVQVFGDGSTVRDYLFITDFCEALYSVITQGNKGGVYNIGSGVGHTTQEVLDCIIATVGEGDKTINYLAQRPFDVQYNVLDCTKLEMLNNQYYRTDLAAGVALSFRWLQSYLKV